MPGKPISGNADVLVGIDDELESEEAVPALSFAFPSGLRPMGFGSEWHALGCDQ